MSDNAALERAEKAVEAAELSTQQLEIVKAVLAAQVVMQAVQQPQPVPVAKESFDTKKWVTIGALLVVGGTVASFLAIALAIGAISVTACLLILRKIYSDYTTGSNK